MRHAQSLREFKKRHNGWIALTAFQAANVLLAEPRAFLHLLLSEPLLSPNAFKIAPDQRSHVHARTLAIHAL